LAILGNEKQIPTMGKPIVLRMILISPPTRSKSRTISDLEDWLASGESQILPPASRMRRDNILDNPLPCGQPRPITRTNLRPITRKTFGLSPARTALKALGNIGL